MAKAKQPSRTAYRDAGSGEFISKQKAESKPANTVVKEKVPLPKPSKKGK